MKKNVSAILILVGAVAFSLASCAKGGNTIKIGGIYPLSGNVAVYGVEAKNGVQMAVEEINAAGGIDGKMLELVAEDDEGNPEKTINAYKKLTTKDRAKIIIGSLTSGCTQAFTSLAQAQKVLVVAPAATMASITDAGNFIFRVCFIDPFQGKVGAKFASADLGAKRAASAAQLASRDAGATSRLGAAGPGAVRRKTSRSASTWIVLPRPMSSARHAPRPRLASRWSQASPARW